MVIGEAFEAADVFVPVDGRNEDAGLVFRDELGVHHDARDAAIAVVERVDFNMTIFCTLQGTFVNILHTNSSFWRYFTH